MNDYVEHLSVDELHLNNKARQVLRKVGISTCGELLRYPPSSLLALRGVGQGTVNHIHVAIGDRLGDFYAAQWLDE